MDSISLLGPPPQPKQPLNQEDFDVRFGLVKKRKIANGRLSKTVTLTLKSAKRIPIPFVRQLQRYNFRENAARDALGSLLLAALLLPQGLGVGLLINDLGGGVLSLLLPQLMSSLLGSLSHATFLIHTSLQSSEANNLASLSLYTGIIQLVIFFLPTQRVYSLISSQLLVGFCLGIFLRIFIFCLPRFLPISGCSYINLCVDDFVNCFFATHWPSAVLSLIAGGLSLLFHLKLNVIANQKLGFTLPHELFIIFSLSLICAQFGFEDPNPTKNLTIFDNRRIALPDIPTPSILIDSFAIALFGAATHIYNMDHFNTNHLRKKQELLVLSISSLVSVPFSLTSGFSSPKNSQVNSVVFKHSLLSNILSTIVLLCACVLLIPSLQYIPTSVIAALVVTSFPNIFNDIRNIKALYNKSPCDMVISVVAFICAVSFPNSCKAFLFTLLFSLICVAVYVQSTPSDVLIKVSDNFFVEENRYRECECPDTPLRILRFSGPLLFINSLQLRKAIYEQVVVVKGLIGVGLGSRTVSLRSTGPGAIGPKESMRSGTNIVITHDGDRPSLSQDNIIRFILLDLYGVTTIDTEGMSTLTRIFVELNNDHIRLFFVGTNASVRDQLERGDFYSKVPFSFFYPNLNEALIACRNISLPFHMSVSMNGYRDVIALSTTGSHQDISNAEAV